MVNIQETLHKCWICVSGATGTDDILVEGGCYFRPIYLLKPFHVDRNPFDPNIFILTDSMKKNVTFYGLEVQEIPGYFEFTGATSGETLDNLEWQLLEMSARPCCPECDPRECDEKIVDGHVVTLSAATDVVTVSVLNGLSGYAVNNVAMVNLSKCFVRACFNFICPIAGSNCVLLAPGQNKQFGVKRSLISGATFELISEGNFAPPNGSIFVSGITSGIGGVEHTDPFAIIDVTFLNV